MDLDDRKVPIVALTGFLGAGKTTLLNHILSTQNGRKIAVIINDFGAINVDSLLVASQTEDTVELSNGSICCAVGEDSLDDVINRIAGKYSIIDLIIIEASGVAEPDHLASTLSRLNSDYARFDSLIYMVDAYEFENTARSRPEMKDHLKAADCVILNKMDSVDEVKQKELKDFVEFVSPGVLTLESSYGKVDVEALLGSITDRDEQPAAMQMSLAEHDDHDHHDEHDHMHDSLTNATFVSNKPMDPDLLLKLFDNPPEGLYRLKGWIDFGMKGVGQVFIAQMVSRRWNMHIYHGNETFDGTQLLLIGNSSLDQAALLKQLEDCVDQAADDVDAQNMIDIFKYDTEYKTSRL